METELFESKTEVCELLDKLLIQTLELIEQDVAIKVNIEKLTNEGYLLLAKTRYIQGQNTVSLANLPSEDGDEFAALKTVTRSSDEINTVQFELQQHEVSSETSHVDPLKWFGIIVPQSLKTAKDHFQKATELVIESANIEMKLKQNYRLFGKLKKIKASFEEE
jgi:hypothetical protein